MAKPFEKQDHRVFYVDRGTVWRHNSSIPTDGGTWSTRNGFPGLNGPVYRQQTLFVSNHSSGSDESRNSSGLKGDNISPVPSGRQHLIVSNYSDSSGGSGQWSATGAGKAGSPSSFTSHLSISNPSDCSDEGKVSCVSGAPGLCGAGVQDVVVQNVGVRSVLEELRIGLKVAGQQGGSKPSHLHLLDQPVQGIRDENRSSGPEHRRGDGGERGRYNQGFLPDTPDETDPLYGHSFTTRHHETRVDRQPRQFQNGYGAKKGRSRRTVLDQIHGAEDTPADQQSRQRQRPSGDSEQTGQPRPRFSSNDSELARASHEQDSRTTSGIQQASPHQFEMSSANSYSAEKIGVGKRCRTCCLVSFLFLLIAAIAVGIALSELLARADDPGLRFVSEVSGTVKVDDEYDLSMADNTSEKFRYYQSMFCYNVAESMKGSLNVTNCTVDKLSPGSVVVEFHLRLSSFSIPTNESLRQLFAANKIKGSNRAIFGTMTIFPDAVRITLKKVENRSADAGDEIGSPLTKDAAYDCAQTDKQFLPEPFDCDKYQLCLADGQVKHFSCADGQEFAYQVDGDEFVCTKPSRTTYCGRKRRESSSPKPYDVTTVSVPTTTMTSESTTVAESTTSVTACPTIGPLEDLYTCPTSGVKFLPRRDTYPGNCGAYTWCVNGKGYNSSKIRCAPGTHFTMKAEPCEWAGSPDTFCAVMDRRQACHPGHDGPEGGDAGDDARETTENFSCAGIDHGYLPLANTYPGHCAAYQQCVNGTGFGTECPGGLHFSQRGGLCIPSWSSDTYCNEHQDLS